MSARGFSLTCLAVACTVASAGIDRGGITRGIITSLEPFVVAGTEFDVSQSVVETDDNPSSLGALSIGQMVVVNAQFDGRPVADSVTEDASLRGTIDSATSDSIVVLGQLVRINQTTRFDGVEPITGAKGEYTILPIGQRVQVSGFLLPDGSLAATHIDLAVAVLDKVSGAVEAVRATQLNIGPIQVDFTDAKLVGFSGMPSAGDHVQVEGTRTGPDTLVASSLTRRGYSLADAYGDNEADIQGYITRFVSDSDFDVDGLRVQISADTTYRDASNLALGIFVTIDGILTEAGTIVAEQVDFGDDD